MPLAGHPLKSATHSVISLHLLHTPLTLDHSHLRQLQHDAVSWKPGGGLVIALQQDVLGRQWLGEVEVDDLSLTVVVGVLEYEGIVSQQIISPFTLRHWGRDQSSPHDDLPEPLLVLKAIASDLQAGDGDLAGQVNLQPGLLKSRLAPPVAGRLRVVHNVINGVTRFVIDAVSLRIPHLVVVAPGQEGGGVGAGVHRVVLKVPQTSNHSRIVWAAGPDLVKQVSM